jgi:hypothetical protein
VRGHFSTLFEPELLINAEVPPETIAPVAAPAIAPDAVLEAPLLSTGLAGAAGGAEAVLPPLKCSKNNSSIPILILYNLFYYIINI